MHTLLKLFFFLIFFSGRREERGGGKKGRRRKRREGVNGSNFFSIWAVANICSACRPAVDGILIKKKK